MESKDKPLFVLKPNIKNAMIPKLISPLIFSIAITLFLSILGYDSIFLGVATFLFLLILFAASPFIFYMNLRNREYRFYKDRLEYYEGWMNIMRHTVPYAKVTDVTMEKTVWDRFFNTATLGLLTAGSHFTSVSIQYVDSPEHVYEYIKEKIIK